MYLMFGDECDHDGSAQFFLYGAIFIDCKKAINIDRAYKKIRRINKFNPGDSLKFAISSKPKNVTREQHTKAKQDIIDMAIKNEVKFCCYAVLNDIATSQKPDQRIQWAVNTILQAFNRFLEDEQDYGIVTLDRLPIKDEYKYFEEWYQLDTEFPTHHKPMPRILSYSSTCNGSSSFSSVADILLGSFRFCVNEVQKDIVGKKLLNKIIQMMWTGKVGGKLTVREFGLLLRPKKEVSNPFYEGQYEELVSRLGEWLTEDE